MIISMNETPAKIHHLAPFEAQYHRALETISELAAQRDQLKAELAEAWRLLSEASPPEIYSDSETKIRWVNDRIAALTHAKAIGIMQKI